MADNLGTRISKSQFSALQIAVKNGQYTQYHYLKSQYGSSLATLYVPGPTGQGLFGSLSHSYTKQIIGADKFYSMQDAVSKTIIQYDFDYIKSTFDGNYYFLPDTSKTIELEIESWRILGLPAESYAGHALAYLIGANVESSIGSISNIINMIDNGFESLIENYFGKDKIIYKGIDYSNEKLIEKDGFYFIKISEEYVPVGITDSKAAQAMGEVSFVVMMEQNPDIFLGNTAFIVGKNGEKVNAGLIRTKVKEMLGADKYENTIESIKNKNPYCFLAGTMVDIWPSDPKIRPAADGRYNKIEVLENVRKKPIEEIRPDDLVISFDDDGHLRPGRVRRLFTNQARIVLDFFGTRVTPGHAYYRADSKDTYKFEPLIDILCDDGVIQNANGILIRAATGLSVDDPRDRFVWAMTGSKIHDDGSIIVKEKGKIRLGTRIITNNGDDICVDDLIKVNNGTVTDDGLIHIGDLQTPFHWIYSETLPTPEAYILKRSGITIENIRAEKHIHAYMPRNYSYDATALAPTPELGWTTYNFEVEQHHTYIADGWRVHNDSQFYIDTVGAIGQTLGTQLGLMLTKGENQFTQLAAGTALGVVTRNLSEVIMDTGFHLFTGEQLDFGKSLRTAIRQLEDVNVDLSSAAAGTVSSFLLAELGEELGLDGFGADLFNVTTSAYAGSVLNSAVYNLSKKDPLLSGADFSHALDALPGVVGTFFGSALASKILPAGSLQGSIGGSLGSIAGSALGSSVLGGALGQSLGVIGNFLLPGIGAFFGTLVGTFIGDLFGDDPEPYATIEQFVTAGLSADRGGSLPVISQYLAKDGFPSDATMAWSKATQDVSLGYARAVGGFDFANAYISGLPISETVTQQHGLRDGAFVRVLQQMYIDGKGSSMKFFVNGRRVATAEKMVDGAIAGFVKDAQIIGGDLLLKRAAANSGASDTPTLSGDMAVAEQYTKYLNQRDVINPFIAISPSSVFAAAWAITLAQAADLDLSDTNISDFHGGLSGFLASLAYAGVSVDPSDVTIAQSTSAKTIRVDIKLDADTEVPGALDVFADKVEIVGSGSSRTLRLTFSNFMKGVGYKRLTGTADGSGSFTDVTGESKGRDIWFAPGSGNYVVQDSGIRVIGVGDAEVISSDDILIGGTGADRLSGGEGWDWIVGGAGKDILDGGSEADTLLGGDGNDTLRGGLDLDYLEGGAGADTLVGGADQFDWDTAGYASSNAAVTINLKTGAASGGHADGDTFSGILNVVGSKYNDTLTGNQYRNSLEGGPGADRLYGSANVSSDIYDFASYFHASEAVVASLVDPSINTGEAAGDRYSNIRGLEGSAFGDVLYGDENANALWGHGGDDILVVGEGADFAYGSAGFDIMSYRTQSDGIVLNLKKWSASSAVVKDDSGVGIEGFEATAYADTITGRDSDSADGMSRNDVIFAGGGNDAIATGLGDDLIDAGAGNDTLNGGGGADTMRGGAGRDTYVVDNAKDVVDESVNGSGGVDKVQSSRSFSLRNSAVVLGVLENLVLTGAGNINGSGNDINNIIIGNTGNNILNGYSGADTLRGGAGNDTYYVDNLGDIVDEGYSGSAGEDTVRSTVNFSLMTSDTLLGDVENLILSGSRNINATGNAGVNVLSGNAGNNIITGGAGRDTLTGGDGADTFVYKRISDSSLAAYDTITDFLVSEGDKVDVSAIDANATGGTSNDKFVYRGSANFSGAAGELRFKNGILQADVNGDKLADLSVKLDSVTSLSAGNLIL